MAEVERVREGMTNAGRTGARAACPSALERPRVVRRWHAVRAQLAAKALSKRAAARQLRVGIGTPVRLLAAPA